MADLGTRELPSGCGICRKEDGLFQCSGCKVIQYCGRDHQVTDRPSHKYICTIVKKARTKMEKQERILHDPSSRWVSGDPFIQDMGNFWGVVETRNYMRERLEIV